MLSKSKQRETQNVQNILSRRAWVVSMSIMMGPFGPGAMTARVQSPSENVPFDAVVYHCLECSCGREMRPTSV